jgi:hypothetical protein
VRYRCSQRFSPFVASTDAAVLSGHAAAHLGAIELSADIGGRLDGDLLYTLTTRRRWYQGAAQVLPNEPGDVLVDNALGVLSLAFDLRVLVFAQSDHRVAFVGAFRHRQRHFTTDRPK